MVVLRRHRSPFRHEEPARRLTPDLPMYALALMILTNVWRIQDLFPVLGLFKLNLVATATTIALLVIDRDPSRHITRLKSPILVCMLGILALAILGVPMSLWPRRSATFVVRDLLPNLLMLVAMAATVRGMRDLSWIAMVNLVGACVYSVFVQLNFQVGPTGRLSNLVYYDANDLALVLVCTLPVTLYFLVRHGWRYRVLALASLMLLLATIAKSGSRGGFLGLVAVSLYVLLGYRVIPARARLVATAAVFGLFAITASEAYWDAIRTLRAPQQDYNWAGASPEGRVELWRRGLGYVAADPFLGVGMANFPLAEGMLSEESRARAERGAGFKWSVAHNSLLEVAVELGLIAFALFLAALFIALRTMHRIRAARPLQDPEVLRKVAFACTLIASLVGFIVAGFFVSAAYYSYLYALLGLCVGLAKIHGGSQNPPVAWPGRRSRLRAVDRMPVALGRDASLTDRVRRSSSRPLSRGTRDSQPRAGRR